MKRAEFVSDSRGREAVTQNGKPTLQPSELTGAFAVDHYPTAGERAADRWIHVSALTVAIPAAVTLVTLPIGLRQFGQVGPLAIYAACLLATFACSAAYNLTLMPRRRGLLRRLDHAAIFLMIAGSYTPFTTQRLTGAWAWGTTGLIWTAALVGVSGKLFLPGVARRVWVVVYLVMSWTALVAIGPLVASVPAPALLLLGLGGATYTAGVLFYVRRTLPFRRAIWHGFVLAAAAIHYGAVLTGVVLAPARM